MIVKESATTEAYNYVLAHALQRGKFPKLDDIAKHFGVSRERARQQMEKLVRLGYLKKLGRRHRGYQIKVVDMPTVNKTVLAKVKVVNKITKKHYNAGEKRAEATRARAGKKARA